MSAPTTLATLLRGFFENYLAAQRDVSQNTVFAYRDAMKLFLRFAARRHGRQVIRLQLSDLGPDTVLAFLDHLETERKNCAATRNCRLVAIHRFFAYVADRDPSHAELCRRVLDIPIKKTSSTSMTYLDQAETKALLAAPPPTQRLGVRDRALLTLMYNTGARASEVVGIDVKDLRLDPPTQVRIAGKGRKERLCPLWTETADVLRAYLDQRPDRADPDAPVFLNAHGGRITRYGVGVILQRNVAIADGARAFSRVQVRQPPHSPPHGRYALASSWRRAQRHQVVARARQHHHHEPVHRDRHGHEAKGNRTLPWTRCGPHR